MIDEGLMLGGLVGAQQHARLDLLLSAGTQFKIEELRMHKLSKRLYRRVGQHREMKWQGQFFPYLITIGVTAMLL